MDTRARRTAFYIDGYNLYYGRLRHTRFKWLDLVALSESLIRVQDPSAELITVRYVSNDSDAEPVLIALRQDFPSMVIGVVTPVPPPVPGARGHRSVSASLARHAHWTRRYILDEELALAQLPLRVPTRKKPAQRPDHW